MMTTTIEDGEREYNGLSVLNAGILFNYYCDCPDAEPPHSTRSTLIVHGLITPGKDRKKYEITEKGRALVKAMLTLPLPVLKKTWEVEANPS